MDIYLIRHADAVALGEGGIMEDALRPLSAKGEQQSVVVGQALSSAGVRLEKLLTSPLLRARQTAEILLQHWASPAPELVVCEELIPDARPKRLARYLSEIGGEQVGLVGHMPHLALFAGWLIGGKRAQIDLAKSGVAYIACGDSPGRGQGTLHWLVTPKWLGARAAPSR